MIRRLELAQALVNRPTLLILDEPTVGLDPVARDGVWQRVGELRRATGMTVLLTTHYMVVMLGSGFFSCLSMTVAGVVLKRDRLLGIGQMITMPLFFASNALYPVAIMPAWLRVLSAVNPLSYEVDALRGLLIDSHAHLALDFGVLLFSLAVGVIAASSLVSRLAR